MHKYFRSKVSILVSILVVSSACLTLLLSAKSDVHAASPHISLSPNHGVPSELVKVSGKAFGMSETISIAFDNAFEATTTTDSTGTFSTKIAIPSSAQPGMHTINAIGNTSSLSASASFLVRTNWPMFGYSSNNRRYNPYENVLSTSNVAGLTLDWTVATGNIIGSSPAVDNGIVYIGSVDGKLYAVDAITGANIWTANTGADIYNSSPAVANNIVYVGAGDNNLYAFNALTGASLWIANNAGASAPTIVNGVIYTGGNYNSVYALNAKTGTDFWTVRLSTIPNNIVSAPAVANGVVYIAINEATTATMYALNASTGTTLWATPMNAQVSNSAPAIANGFVYIGVGDGLLYAFNAKTGKIQWTSPNIGNVIASPAVFNGIVFIGGNGLNNHKLFAFNAKTGAIIWTANTNGNMISSATVANGVVYDGSFNSNNNFYAFDATTGAILWTGTVVNSTDISSPSVANGVVYVGSDDHNIYAFHL